LYVVLLHINRQKCNWALIFTIENNHHFVGHLDIHRIFIVIAHHSTTSSCAA